MLRWLVRRALRELVDLYYVQIRVVGEENLPRRGPAIVVANHPNSIMDPLLISTRLKPDLAFLARSGLFSNPVVGGLLRWLGAIPVYRRQDGPAPPGSNESAFSAAYELLGNAGVLGLFPEGQNAPERHLGEVKTGAARIAIGAVNEGFAKQVSIVPIGLNYEDRDRYLTEVLIRVGTALEVDTKIASANDASELTATIRSALEAQMTHLEDSRHTELLHEVAAFLRAERIPLQEPELADTALRESTSNETGLANYDAIAQTLNHYARHDPSVIDQVAHQLSRYKRNVQRAQLKFDFAHRTPQTLSRRREAIKFSLTALTLYPIGLLAWLQHAPAFFATRAYALKAPEDAMRAVRALACAAVLFPATYVAIGSALALLGASALGVLFYLSVLPIGALLWLRVRTRMEKLADRLLLRDLFVKRRTHYRRLLLEREALLARLDGLRRAVASHEPPRLADGE